MTKHCPACAEVAVPASGYGDADILIVGEFPGESELERGKPFVGNTGKVLKAELRHVGIEYALCRVCNLWLHAPNGDENCFKAGYDYVLDEAKGRKAILLVGSDVVKAFTDYNVMEVCGLQIDVPVFTADTVFAMLNPAIAFQESRGIGEVRLSLSKFAAALREKGILE